MTAAVAAAPVARARPAVTWGLYAFIWLLPVHALLITVLFGALGWPATTVRGIAAWKEALIAVLFTLALVRALRHAKVVGAVHWLDLAVAGLGMLALGYLIGANAWFGSDLPLAAELYGVRDVAFVSLLYFVGRATPEVVGRTGVLRALVAVAVLTSVVAIVERVLVTPEVLVLLGASRYVQDFLGAAATTTGNVYGLPDNYWTEIGGRLIQRAGSTYLSAQGLAISFLILMPAATIWATTASGAKATLRWLGYGVLWVALLLTVTRMTILVCAVQVAVVLAARRHWAALVGLGLAGLSALVAAFLLVPNLADFVYQTLTWQTPSSVVHLRDWIDGLEYFLRHPLGVGLGSTDFVAARFGLTHLTADNQYLRYGVELGSLGLLSHLAILAGGVANGTSVWLTAREPAAEYGLLLAVATCGIVVNGLTAVVFNAIFVAYVFYWLAGSLTTIVATRGAPG
ncbi:MAG TPA: O-antigen ligase family protein [Gemmatimonadales bacterium]|nr:O-antigen ligase family protein [Gemmatimonadales bacterium]